MTNEADGLADFYAEHLGHVTSSAVHQLMELFDQSGIQSLPDAAKDAIEKLILNSYKEIQAYNQKKSSKPPTTIADEVTSSIYGITFEHYDLTDAPRGWTEIFKLSITEVICEAHIDFFRSLKGFAQYFAEKKRPRKD